MMDNNVVLAKEALAKKINEHKYLSLFEGMFNNTSEHRKFLKLIVNYTNMYVFTAKYSRIIGDIGEYGTEMISSSESALKYYKSEKGSFLTYYINILTKDCKKAKSLRVREERRYGIKISTRKSIDISKIIKFVRENELNVNSPEHIDLIASKFSFDTKYINECLRINNEVCVDAGYSNNDGENFNIIDSACTARLEDTCAGESLIIEVGEIIEREYQSCQNRSNLKRIFQMTITAWYIETFQMEKDIISKIKHFTFLSKTVLRYYFNKGVVPKHVNMIKAMDVSKESFSRTYNSIKKSLDIELHIIFLNQI